MAKQMTTAEDVNAWQAKNNYRRFCSSCVREWYDSLVRTCPVSGRDVCLYCCQGCDGAVRDGASLGCRKGARA